MSHTLTGGVLHIGAGFTEPLDWDIVQKDGVTALVLAAGDVVHFQLYSAPGGSVLLTIDDLNPSVNGSSVSITTRGNAGTNTPASGQVTLDEDDTLALSGEKYFVMWFDDSGDGNRNKIFRRGMINFLRR